MNDNKKMLLQKDRYSYEDLVTVVEILRGESGCPWDREQTHESLRECLLEEAYEAAEGIDLADTELLKEELGDLLLQIVFHAQIEKEQGNFTMDDVANGVCRKMIRRHPHIFKEESVSSATEVVALWENIKSEEKKRDTPKKVLDSIPITLPSLRRSQKLVKKAGKLGYREEAFLLPESVEKELMAKSEGERAVYIGRLLREICALGDAAGISCEDALALENRAFLTRAENKLESQPGF